MKKIFKNEEQIKILDNQLKQLGSYLNAAEQKIKDIQDESHEIKLVMRILLSHKESLVECVSDKSKS